MMPLFGEINWSGVGLRTGVIAGGLVDYALDTLKLPGGRALFQPVALLLRRRDGQVHMAAAERIVPLLRRIRRGWRPAARMKVAEQARQPL